MTVELITSLLLVCINLVIPGHATANKSLSVVCWNVKGRLSVIVRPTPISKPS